MKTLGDHSHSKKKQEILSPNEVASRHIKMGIIKLCKNHKKTIKAKPRRQKKNLQQYTIIGAHFTLEEVNKALSKTKLNKAAGYDEVYPEFIKHAGPRVHELLARFYNDKLDTVNISKSFKGLK